MKSLLYALPLFLISGCIYWVPMPSTPDGGETDGSFISSPDAGTASAATDAGSPTATDAGPSVVTDAGPTGNNDGGVISTPITTLAPLDPAKCGTARTLLTALRPTCSSTNDACLSWLNNGSPAVPVNLPGQSRAAFFQFTPSSLVSGTSSALIFSLDAGSQRLMQLIDSAGAITPIETGGTVWQNSIVFDSTGFWYLRMESSGNVLRRWTAATGTVTLGTLSTSNFDAAAVAGGSYLFMDSNGITEAQPYGGVLSEQRLINLPITSMLGAFAAEGDDVYFTDCAMVSNYRCVLKRYQRSTAVLTTLIGETFQIFSAQIVLDGNHVYVLDALKLLRVPRAGGPIETLYEGEIFPQYEGTLRHSSLRVNNGKAYFGQVCKFDYDAPTYAAVELNLQTRVARYLENDPAYPLVPKLEGRVGEGPLDSIVQSRQNGLFILGK